MNRMLKYVDLPTATVDTPLGQLWLTIVDGNHIYVDASGNGKSLQYRGNPYSTSMHLEYAEDVIEAILRSKVMVA